MFLSVIVFAVDLHEGAVVVDGAVLDVADGSCEGTADDILLLAFSPLDVSNVAAAFLCVLVSDMTRRKRYAAIGGQTVVTQTEDIPVER